MIFGEGHIRQHVRLGLVQEGGEPAVRWTELVGDLAPLGLGGVGIVLGEGGGNESGDDAPAVLAGVGKRVAHEVDAGAVEKARIEASRAASVALGLGYR